MQKMLDQTYWKTQRRGGDGAGVVSKLEFVVGTDERFKTDRPDWKDILRKECFEDYVQLEMARGASSHSMFFLMLGW